MSETTNLRHKIYVRLLDEGTSVWRPVEAVKVSEGMFRIVTANQNPEDEEWEFVTETVVRCTEKSFGNGRVGLAAIEKVDSQPKS